MVVKRSCSFCAGEIEPGTGMMFVKRDGTVFHFCSSSCRKQQLHLGRVGHRLKWTRAHALKRAAEQASPKASASAPRTRPEPAVKPTPAPEPKSSPAPSGTGPSEKAPPAKPRKSGGRAPKRPAA